MEGRHEKFRLPRYEDIPKESYGPVLKLTLSYCSYLKEQLELCYRKLGEGSAELDKQAGELEALNAELNLEKEANSRLKDEVADLKKSPRRPKVKPSGLNKKPKTGKRGKPRRKKTRELEIHEEVVITPKDIPEGSIFKGYEDYVVQDIKIEARNTKFRRARYKTPDGSYLVGELPKSVNRSHFGPRLKSYIICQHFESQVTQSLLLKELRSYGIRISSGQLSKIITERHEAFHREKDEVLRAGLEVSSYINVDDTGARHRGKNGVSTHIGNELFAWFSSTESKSRINFLELLRTGFEHYVIDDVARSYMALQKLPKYVLSLLEDNRMLADKSSWESFLQGLGISDKRHLRIVTEGALVACIVETGVYRDLVIVSDDAGQFNVAGFLNALCWVHAERTISKIIPYSDKNREILKGTLDKIWEFYKELKEYKKSPNAQEKERLESGFDEIFATKTSFQILDNALKRIYDNKEELLLVLSRPEIPLHNNLSENDIRIYVKKRKISSGTRSEAGRQARDTFLSLSKTCKKLNIPFWDFLLDRFSFGNKIPPLASVIRNNHSPP